MNKRILKVLVLLMLSICFAVADAANDTSSVAKSVNNDLVMQITSDSKKYKAFDPIKIRITIINNTPKEIIFNKRFAVIKQRNSGEQSEISFKITKPNGTAANIEFVSEPALLSESDFVKIKSKSKYEKQLDINQWYWKELSAPGGYTFQCIYHNDKSGYLVPGDEGDVLMEMYAWTGDLESNVIIININEMSKDEVLTLASKLTNESIYWGERSKVAELLGDVKSNWALDALISRLTLSENEVVRNKSVEAIVKYGNFPIKRLIKHLNTSDPIARVLSAKALCLLGEKKGLGAVRKELTNKNWQVVIEAMSALQCLDKDIAVKDIIKHDLINNKDEVVSFTAIDILKKLGVKVDFNEKLRKWKAVK